MKKERLKADGAREILTLLHKQKGREISFSGLWALTTIKAYAHLYNLMVELVGIGLITYEQVGRENLAKLTDKGRAVAQCYARIDKLMRE